MEAAEDDLHRRLSARSYMHQSTVDSAQQPIDNLQRTNNISPGVIPDGVVAHSVSRDTKRLRSLSQRLGRPRIEAPSNAILTEKRRKQVRQAQSRYRLKKEAKLEKLQTLVDDLEQRLERTSQIISDFRDAAFQCNLNETHPKLFSYFDEMRCLIKAGQGDGTTLTRNESHSESRPASVSIHCSSHNVSVPQPETVKRFQAKDLEVVTESEIESSSAYAVESPRLRSDTRGTRPRHDTIRTIERPLGRNDRYRLCFQEPSFSRRLQRYCLEYAFRLFSDTASNPVDVYRVFRLVPCIKDRYKMYPHFRRLVVYAGGNQDSLDMPKLPFYCIGGAGTHYPQKDENGNPVYPSKMRLPGRILGILPDKNGDISSKATRMRNLALFGYDGEWFDCNDVAGYLAEIGVDLESDQLFAVINTGHHKGMEQFVGAAAHSERLQDVPDTNMRLFHDDDNIAKCVLDVESFFTKLLQGIVILGRAPGFRKSDVEAALQSSMRIRTGK